MSVRSVLKRSQLLNQVVVMGKLELLKYKKPIFLLLISLILMVNFILIALLLSNLGFIHSGLYLVFDIIFLSILFIIGPLGFYFYIKSKKSSTIFYYLT